MEDAGELPDSYFVGPPPHKPQDRRFTLEAEQKWVEKGKAKQASADAQLERVRLKEHMSALAKDGLKSAYHPANKNKKPRGEGR
jgi:hypothetical protein